MALGRYDINFILRTTDRTGNTMRTVARDMGMMTKQAKLTRAAFLSMDVGRGLQLRGLLGGAALGVAAQQAATFESSVTKAATQMADSTTIEKIASNTKQLSKEVLDLMKQFPGTAEQQAAAAYDIFSAMNVPLEKGVGLLKLFNMVAVAGATDLETASDAMITLLNTFGGSWKDTMNSVNTSFAVVRFGKMEFAEFNNMLQSVVPAAKGAGQSLQDVGGAMAFLSTRMKPNIAATALSRLLEVMARPDFQKGAHDLGLEITDLSGRLKPLPQVIDELARLPVAKIKGTINSLIPLLTAVGRGGGRGTQSTVFARRALVTMIEQRADFQKLQGLTLTAQSEFEKRYTMMIGSAGVRWEKFKASMQAVLIIVGQAAIPIFEKLGEKVAMAIAWARANQGLVTFAAKWIAVLSVASLAIGTFMRLGGALVIVATGFYRLTKAMAGFAIMSKVVQALGYTGALLSLVRTEGIKATSALLPLVGMLRFLGAVGLITITILVLTEFKAKGRNEMFKWFDENVVKPTGQALQKTGMPPLMVAGGALEGIAEADAKIREKNLADIKKNVKDGKGSNKEIAKVYDKSFKGLIKDIKKAVGSTGGELFNAKMLKDMGLDPESMNKALNELWGTQAGGGGKIDNAKRIANEIAQQTKDLLDQASDALMQVYEGFKSANQEAFGNIFEPIEGEGEEAQLRKAWNWTGGANNLLDTMKARLAQFKKWRGSLNMLLKKGFSKEFVEEFKKMGPEGMKHLDELKKAGPKRVKEFNRVFAAGKGAVTKATEIDFNAQLKKWNKFGKETALKIILGMESEEQGVQQRMVGMVQRMYSGVAAEIATQAVMLQEAANAAAQSIDLTPFMATPATAAGSIRQKEVRAAGLEGRYAIPSASTTGLTPAAVYAMGARYEAMAAAYARQGWTPGKTGGFEPTGNSYTFNVNGTFLTHEEAMMAAMRQAAHRTKNKR